MQKADFPKIGRFARRSKQLRLKKFSEILNSNARLDKFLVHQIKIAFNLKIEVSCASHFLTGCNVKDTPPGFEVLNFSIFLFILHYKHPRNLFK